MSIETALQFIRQVRQDGVLQNAFAALGDEVSFEEIIEFAQRSGFSISGEDLQRAHKYDWAMRCARYQPTNPAESGNEFP